MNSQSASDIWRFSRGPPLRATLFSRLSESTRPCHLSVDFQWFIFVRISNWKHQNQKQPLGAGVSANAHFKNTCTCLYIYLYSIYLHFGIFIFIRLIVAGRATLLLLNCFILFRSSSRPHSPIAPYPHTPIDAGNKKSSFLLLFPSRPLTALFYYHGSSSVVVFQLTIFVSASALGCQKLIPLLTKSIEFLVLINSSADGLWLVADGWHDWAPNRCWIDGPKQQDSNERHQHRPRGDFRWFPTFSEASHPSTCTLSLTLMATQ